jgi:hypothetical protein
LFNYLIVLVLFTSGCINNNYCQDTKQILSIVPGVCYLTKGGREVRIYAVDNGSPYPVHGAIKLESGQWFQHTWAADGTFNLANRDTKNNIVSLCK